MSGERTGRTTLRKDRVATGSTALSAVTADAAVEDLFRFTESDVARFPTGYSLDDTCGCIGPGELGLLWARSGSGKSTWLLNILASSPKVPTVIFNMEMTARRQIEWLMAMTFDLSTPARRIDEVLARGDTTDDAYTEVVSSLRAMKTRYPTLNFVNPSKSPSVPDFAKLVDQVEDDTGVRPQRVFIDHLTLMANARDYEGVTRTAGALHSWAMSDELAVIAIQQTGRSGGADGGRNDGHLPVTLSSGVYGGEHDADWIWGMYRPERDPKFHKLTGYQLDGPKREALAIEQASVRGITKFQLIKNRPYGETREEGITLRYNPHNRLLIEGT